MWRMSVLFPQPLSPMITKTWPRATAKLRSFWIKRSP